MAIKIPTRNYLTFAELQERWGCSERDLSFAIISAELKPCVRLIGKHQTLVWEIDGMGDWVASPYEPGNTGYAIDVDARGWQYLQDPVQTASFDCEFRFAADERDPEKDEIPFAIWRRLNNPISLGQIKETAVFLLEEVAIYEAKYGNESEYKKTEKPQSKRERDTLLTIIAVLAKAAKVPLDDYSKPGKAAGYIEGLTVEFGAPVSKRAIEDHLKKISDALGTRMK